MGFEVRAVVGSDSSAARGITQRLGTGRVRHLEARHLWIQDKVREKNLSVRKVTTEDNRGDVQTKPLEPGRHWSLMNQLPFDFSGGCKDTGDSSMQVGALTVGKASAVLVMALVADGVTGAAASEEDHCSGKFWACPTPKIYL